MFFFSVCYKAHFVKGRGIRRGLRTEAVFTAQLDCYGHTNHNHQGCVLELTLRTL